MINDLIGFISDAENKLITTISNAQTELIASIDEDFTVVVKITETGPQGPQGVPGALYPIPETYSANKIIETDDKMFVSAEEKSRIDGYIHDQIASSKNWTINHGLNKYPSVAVADSAGSIVIGDVKYIDDNTVTVRFNSEFSGKAYLN